ncbi:hypothetical protein [Ciceribacter selenitireducens]|jgi:hypothetical protein|uniref:Uncharacterized protein n=1 Tax=Ciceribacter selenitireducens ATCC BAA-1503 TaxID=1336235 RepID=A0A376AIE5_9HYPH|nr:hypothetical protein [Ciceribacter selenitireducens]SSC67602.1 unnamed protein product [Ciceribacter selenitireducens ATCC BAA-1503]
MASPLTCIVYSTIALNTWTKRCRIDGRLYDVHLGKWMFYNPALQEKYFHVRAGKIDSTARSRPSLRQLTEMAEDQLSGRYPISVWKEALATPISRRLAEIWIAAKRLHRNGLGPEPGSLVIASQYKRNFRSYGPTVGLKIGDARLLPPRDPVTQEEMIAAGVQPDRYLSCVRQTINGYVSDLCSVVGVVPIDAEDEVRELAEHIDGLLNGSAAN